MISPTAWEWGRNVAIDRRTVEHVARLSRLSLSDREKERLERELGKILEHIDKLNRLDTSGVEPMAAARGAGNVLRADVPAGSMAPEQVMANAPRKWAQFYMVPPVIE